MLCGGYGYLKVMFSPGGFDLLSSHNPRIQQKCMPALVTQGCRYSGGVQ